MGLYGLDIPPAFGGPDIDLVTRTLMAVEMAQHRAGLTHPVTAPLVVPGWRSCLKPLKNRKKSTCTPRCAAKSAVSLVCRSSSGGSDPARAIQTKAVQDGDDWIINGGKLWISGADKAQYGLVFARTANDKGRNGVTCFIVDTDTPGFAVRRTRTCCEAHTMRLNLALKTCGFQPAIFWAS